MKTKILCFVSLLAGLAHSCSDSNSVTPTSNLSDVSNPGDPGNNNVLYWVDQTNLVRGTCTKDRPTTRANCGASLTKTLLTEAQQRAGVIGQAEIDRNIADIATEVKKLKSADPTVVSLTEQVTSLTNQKSRLEAGIKADNDLNTQEKQTKARFDEQIAFDDQQLAEVAKQLQATPNDRELLDLQAKLTQERALYAASSSATAARITKIEARLASQQQRLAKATADLKIVQDELTKVYAELNVTSPALTELEAARDLNQAAKASIPALFAFVAKETVTYRGNLLSAALQRALVWVDKTFEATAMLTPGRYIVQSGYSSYCPQKIEPAVNSGGKISIPLTYLSPCGGTRHVMACTKNVCSYQSYSITVTDSTHYTYKDSSHTAVFVFKSPSLESDITPNGPENSSN